MKCERCRCRLFISEHILCYLCSRKVSMEMIQEIRAKGSFLLKGTSQPE